MKCKVDRPLCIGAGTCVASAPSVFELDTEGKAVMLKTDGSKTSDETHHSELTDANDTTLMEAAKVCPTGAIILTDDSGTQVYP